MRGSAAQGTDMARTQNSKVQARMALRRKARKKNGADHE